MEKMLGKRNMVDIAALAAFVVYNEMKPINRSDRLRVIPDKTY